jgi:hypothetical protein
LFSLSNDVAPWEGPVPFDFALAELGGPDVNEVGDADSAAQWLAQAILDGVIVPLEACAYAAQLCVASDYQHDALGGYYGFDDEWSLLNDEGWSYAGRSVQDIDADVSKLAADIARHGSRP